VPTLLARPRRFLVRSRFTARDAFEQGEARVGPPSVKRWRNRRPIDYRKRSAKVLETAKLNGLDPEAYLADVIDRMAKGHSINRLGELLPWNWQRQAAKMAA
jgi:hypothetical protein